MKRGTRTLLGIGATILLFMLVPAGGGTTRAAAKGDVSPAGRSAAPQKGRAIVEQRGTSPRQRLREAFRDARPEQVPTGVLLERGALGARQLILENDGGGRSRPVTRLEFANAWGDLKNAEVSTVLPTRATLARRSGSWRERRGAVPIALAVVEYDSLADRDLRRARPDVRGTLSLPRGRLGEPGLYVAAAVEAEAVYRFNPRLVVPSRLFASNVAEAWQVSHLTVRVGDGAPRRVEFDVPFTLPHLPEENGRHELVVSFELDGMTRVARSVFRLDGEGSGVRGAVPAGAARPCVAGVIQVDGIEIPYYDLPPVTGRISWTDPLDAPGEGAFGTLNLRVYPGSGTVEPLGNGECRVNLLRPIVAVDGFDYSNTRTQESIWNDFGAAFRKFLLWDFDVVTVDYANGRDWLQRNGYAVRELLVHGLEDIVDPGVLAADRVIVVGGSMGTQTCRWALRTAELDGEDHNTGLFVAVDGPFRGANIPISLHAALDWGAEVFAGLGEFLEGLNSHAAIQQLRRTRYTDASGHTVWYQQHPRGAAYYAAVDAAGFGLPRRTRNVTLSSGSGTGTLQNDGSVQELIYTDPDLWKNILGAQFGVKAYAKTDFGRSFWLYDLFPWLRPAVFYGVADDRVLFNIIDLGILPGGIRKLRVSLDRADYLDIAPGGYRTSPRQLLDAAADLGLEGQLLSDLEVHGFIPTFSALGVDTDDVYFNPSEASDIASRIPFDNFFWEKCNRQHVEITDDALGFLMRELAAFSDETTPPGPALYERACGEPEAQDLCLGLVTWLSDPGRPRDLVPWYDGANCYVTPVPGGRTGRVRHNSYYVNAEGGACSLGVFEQVGEESLCRLGSAPRETTAFVYMGSFYYDGAD